VHTDRDLCLSAVCLLSVKKWLFRLKNLVFVRSCHLVATTLLQKKMCAQMQACLELWSLNLTDNSDNDILLQEACFSNQHVQMLRVTKGPKMNTKKFGML